MFGRCPLHNRMPCPAFVYSQPCNLSGFLPWLHADQTTSDCLPQVLEHPWMQQSGGGEHLPRTAARIQDAITRRCDLLECLWRCFGFALRNCACLTIATRLV